MSVEDSSSDWIASFGGPVYSAFIDAGHDFDHYAAAAATLLTDIEAVEAEAAVTSEVVVEDGAHGS